MFKEMDFFFPNQKLCFYTSTTGLRRSTAPAKSSALNLTKATSVMAAGSEKGAAMAAAATVAASVGGGLAFSLSSEEEGGSGGGGAAARTTSALVALDMALVACSGATGWDESFPCLSFLDFCFFAILDSFFCRFLQKFSMKTKRKPSRASSNRRI